MTAKEWMVVKVGGSLFDLPDLRDRLRAWLAGLDTINVLLVPGGGATADAIRDLDRVHRLGDGASHWLAIDALSVNARFLSALVPGARILGSAPPAQAWDVRFTCAAGSSMVFILDAFRFFFADEASPDHLPHRWEVTSDSLAVRAAVLVKARELVLLKSVGWESSDWSEAVRAGVVDPFFTEALRQASVGMKVRVVNLRSMP